MRRTPRFSHKTRAVLNAMSKQPLTAMEICQATGLSPKEVHPRIQNAVRSGYAIIAPEAAIGRSRTVRRYSAVEMVEKIEPFKARDGRFDFSALLNLLGPSAQALPAGTARLVRRFGEEETLEEFESPE